MNIEELHDLVDQAPGASGTNKMLVEVVIVTEKDGKPVTMPVYIDKATVGHFNDSGEVSWVFFLHTVPVPPERFQELLQ